MSALHQLALGESKNSGVFTRSGAGTPEVVLPRRTHPKAWAGLIAGATIAVVAAVYQPWHLSSPRSVAAETATMVMVAQPTQAVAAKVVLPATLRPWQTTTLYARVSGYLTAWHRDLGSEVKAGELLAEIETPELDQELAEGEALAREAEAAVVQAQAERIEAQADLKVADAQLLRAQAEHELAKSQLARRDKLVRNRVITQEEHDTYFRQVEARAADVAAAQSDVARRQTNLDTRAAVITARQATAKSRKSNVDRLKELQGFKRIVAPFDGVISRRTAEVGMLVTADQEALFVVDDLSRIRVQINVPQTYAMQTRPGVAATIRLPESNVRPVQGAITRVAQSVEASSRTMLAEIELSNANRQFQPGSYAQAMLTTAPTDSAWTIPTNTLAMRVDGPHVALVNSQAQIAWKAVTLGRDLGDRVVVADGIHGGELLVVNPRDDLSDGLRVHVDHSQAATSTLAR